MLKNKSTKLTICLITAVLLVASVMLAACNGNAFQPVDMPELGKTPEGNGGNAVKYGDWIYYVNGYQSSASAENTYEQIDARVGAIARIKTEDLESMFAVYDDANLTTSTARTNAIAKIVEEKAEIVVPKFYYSGNTTSTNINGIYIFNDRLYILTPNDELTSGGNSLTSQSVLTSFKLDGSDEQRHFVFTNNAAQVMLLQKDGKLLVNYIMGTEVGTIDVATGTVLGKVEETSNAQIDVAGNCVVYIKDKAICKLNAGADSPVTLVSNEKDSKITYTISNINNGNVYYTKADSTNSSVDNIHVYYVNESNVSTNESERIALSATAPSSNWYGYGAGIVKSTTDSVNGTSLYGINIVSSNGTVVKPIVDPVKNDSSITFNRIEGDVLYYTSNNVAYKVDLSAENPQSEAFGLSLASASGWSVPDILGEYVITLSSGSVSAVKFDKETKTNSSSVTMTIVKPAEEK